jgi:type VI secretion system secreted protein VgrG
MFKNILKIVLATVLVVMFAVPMTTLAVIPPDRTFGITDTYSVYGHAGITNTGAGTRVWGNVGGNGAGTAGFTAVQVPSGTIDDTGPTGTLIENDASSVYDSLMSATQGVPTALNLAGTHTTGNGNPITPGVYDVGATTLNGAVELSGAGVYIFRSDSSLTIATSGGTMTLTNGATPCNVFWAVPASMTIGTGSQMVGTIIAHTGLISLGTGATLQGRAISLVSQVTLDTNQITQPTCAAPVVPSSGGSIITTYYGPR